LGSDFRGPATPAIAQWLEEIGRRMLWRLDPGWGLHLSG